jgi:hypothetical protein
MRSRHFWMGLASTVSVTCAIFVGCGGSSSDDSAVNTPDTGPDVTAMDAAPDTAKLDTGIVETGPEACSVDADLATLPVPDAALGDSGATAPECVSCVKSACPGLLPKCQMTCDCVTAFVSFEACVGMGTSVTTCATTILLNSDTGLMLQDVECALGCEASCGIATPTTDGGDGGDGAATSDGGDGGDGGDAAH